MIGRNINAPAGPEFISKFPAIGEECKDKEV